ncbi:MAG: hypothetical protein Q9161_005894 [Pseudevernia consocians]
MELVNALDVLVDHLKDDRVLVIMNIEKYYGHTDPDSEALLDGRKELGSGSREVLAALKEVEMENITIMEDKDFKFEFELFEKQKRRYKYFMVRETKVQGGED